MRARGRIGKPQPDIRGLASAVPAWTAPMGTLPSVLGLLTATATNAQNITAGPFMAAIPTPPSTAWAPRTPTAPTPTAPSIRSRPPPPAPPFPRRNQRGMGPQEAFLSPGALSISADPAG